MNFKTLKVVLLVLILFLIANAVYAACYDCGSGTSDEQDNRYWCECDQDEKCKDFFTQSTAIAGGSGIGCSYDSQTDYCIDGQNLREYYVDCYFCDEVFSVDKNCEDYSTYDNYVYYCSGDEKRTHRQKHDWDCITGACTFDNDYWVDDSLVQNCNNDYEFCNGDIITTKDGYCSGGSCLTRDIPILDCDSFDAWICDGDAKEYRDSYCSSGACSYSYSGRYECDNYNYCDNWQVFCDGDIAKKKQHCYDYNCNSGDCNPSSYWNEENIQDCNTKDTAWQYYMEGDCLKKKRQNYYCSIGACIWDWEYVTVSCNGDSTFCTDKWNYFGIGCGYEQYDCDSNEECTTGYCKLGSSSDGCCWDFEVWNDVLHKCKFPDGYPCSTDTQCNSGVCAGTSHDMYRSHCVDSTKYQKQTQENSKCCTTGCYGDWQDLYGDYLCASGYSCDLGSDDVEYQNESSLPSTLCKKSDGQSCSTASDCLTDHYCVHGACRSDPYYCGDGFCDTGEPRCEADGCLYCRDYNSDSTINSDDTKEAIKIYFNLPGKIIGFTVTKAEVLHCINNYY